MKFRGAKFSAEEMREQTKGFPVFGDLDALVPFPVPDWMKEELRITAKVLTAENHSPASRVSPEFPTKNARHGTKRMHFRDNIRPC